jgi:hypothetical protein
MLPRDRRTAFFAILVIAAAGSHGAAWAADKEAPKQEGKVAGLLIEKKDNWITVKADGEEERVKYALPDGADKKLAEAFKWVFNASRVQLAYKKNGDARELTSIRRQVLKPTGTATGVVVKNYGFWIEVKPKTGLPDAFAPGPKNFNNKEFMAQLKDLKPGDSVTIKFTTDLERHRIETLHKNEDAPAPSGK